MNKYFNIIIIIVILGIVFLAQQPSFQKAGHPVYTKIMKYWEFTKAKSEHLLQNIWNRVKDELQKRKIIFKSEVAQEGKKIEKEVRVSIFTRIKNFFIGNFLNFGKSLFKEELPKQPVGE